MRARQRVERRRGLAVGVGHPHRHAGVGALADGGDERDLPEQRHVEVVGERLAPAGAEELVARAVVAGEPRHVLDHAAHRQLELLRRVAPTAGRPAGRPPAAW